MPMKLAVKEIFADETSGNAWTNRTPQRIIRTGVDGSIQISTPINSGMSKYSAPYYSESNGNSITIGTSDNSTAPPCGLNAILKIDDIRKSNTPYLRKFNKLDAVIDEKFIDNLVAPPILTEAICDKLSKSSIQDIYM